VESWLQVRPIEYWLQPLAGQRNATLQAGSELNQCAWLEIPDPTATTQPAPNCSASGVQRTFIHAPVATKELVGSTKAPREWIA
jgi:hypothetical protein